MKSRIYLDSKPVTMRAAMNEWRKHYLGQGGDPDFADEIFALGLYEGDATDAEMSPEHARDLMADAGIEMV